MKRQSQFPQPSNPRVLVCGDGAGANIALRFAAKVTLFSQRHHCQGHYRHYSVYHDLIIRNIIIMSSISILSSRKVLFDSFVKRKLRESLVRSLFNKFISRFAIHKINMFLPACCTTIHFVS